MVGWEGLDWKRGGVGGGARHKSEGCKCGEQEWNTCEVWNARVVAASPPFAASL
ncbi:MAG: hypothetical protein ACKERG_01000 [Candidatus Hodgkinia cicadicola]